MSEADVELVRVYKCSNPALVPVVESLLNDAEIVFMTKGADSNYVTGPIEFWVRADEEAEAREILTALDEATPLEE